MAKEKKPKRSAAEKAKAQYTGYTVKEPMELMEFLASKMHLRDLQLLDVKYKVKAVQPVDMFPHTHHVENVVLLELR